MKVEIKKINLSPIDTGKTIITKPALIKAYRELEEKKESGENFSVVERIRLGKLKKYGDNATCQNKISKEIRPTKKIDLEKLNKAPLNITREKSEKIIERMFNGKTLIQACNVESIEPAKFLNFIDKEENQDLKNQYFNSRIVLAEFYLERREELERDLRENRIDSSTYSTLSNDYKYLAGKLAPLAYGDKIQLDANIQKNVAFNSIDSEKVKALNNLLNDTIIDADYTLENPNS